MTHRLAVHPAARILILLSLCLGLNFWVHGDPLPGQGSGPAIDCPSTVTAGSMLYGTASDTDSPITVTGTIDGTHVSGSPDNTQDGNVNSFCFQPDASQSGKWLKVEAQDGLGNVTTKWVHVL